MNKIDESRSKLDELDQQIFQLLRERQDVLKEIAEYKIETGHALFDRAREKDVFEKARKNAAAAGLDPNFGEKLMQVIVEGSHNFQEKMLSEHNSQGEENYNILIVGGQGAMGQLFRKLFEASGQTVTLSDVDDVDDRRHQVANADIVILAVNMSEVCEVAKSILPYVKREGLLMDINSLKGEICKVIKHAAGEVMGTHPMFGPTTSSLRRQKVVVCPLKPGPISEWVLKQFKSFGLEVIESDPETHDRIMALIQVLVHFKTLTMGLTLSQSGVSIEETLKYTSPIYHLELSMIGRLFAQSSKLYAEIEMSNPFGDEIRQSLQQAAGTLEKVIADKDKEGFEKIFNSVQEYFSGFQEVAMRNSDRLIEDLVRRG
jgi:chorismate mutase/prephenate dehydrogenase